jgi:hypothetical protein
MNTKTLRGILMGTGLLASGTLATVLPVSAQSPGSQVSGTKQITGFVNGVSTQEEGTVVIVISETVYRLSGDIPVRTGAGGFVKASSLKKGTKVGFVFTPSSNGDFATISHMWMLSSQ